MRARIDAHAGDQVHLGQGVITDQNTIFKWNDRIFMRIDFLI